MKETANSYKRQRIFYGGIFLLGIIITPLYLIHLVQTMNTVHVFRMILKVLVLAFCVVKTVDCYKAYKRYAGGILHQAQ
jgi:hypothetical protein